MAEKKKSRDGFAGRPFPDDAPLHIGAVLKQYREKAGYSQSQMAEMFHVSRLTIINWESDKFVPDARALRRFMILLGIPPAELFDLPGSLRKSPDDEKLLHLFHELSPEYRELYTNVIFAFLTDQRAKQDRQLKTDYLLLAHFETRPAAGIGTEFGEDDAAAPLFLRVTAESKRADAVLDIWGKSMEPKYPDGASVYVKYTDHANPGDVVVCSTNDGAVIKALDEHMRLYSLNPDVPYPMKTEDDSFRILGRVIGIVDPSDLPDADQAKDLERVFGAELRQFERRYRREASPG